MRIIFFGSDDFAAVNLQQLLASQHEVVACVTGPDKAQGRGMKLAGSPIKQLALDHAIPCLQPASLKEAAIVDALKAFNADIFVVVAYGRLLTQQILDIPKIFCVNVHGSLLPKYRGAAPVNWAVLNGDKETGVTVQKMALALDAGDIIAQEQMTIGDREDAAQLRERMALVGAKLLVRTLDAIAGKAYSLMLQDTAQMTYASKLTKEMGKIDWTKSAQMIDCQIRGLKPWPGAVTTFNGKMLKIISAHLVKAGIQTGRPGSILSADNQGLLVATGNGHLMVTDVHPEAGKAMTASSFMAGYKIKQGNLLE